MMKKVKRNEAQEALAAIVVVSFVLIWVYNNLRTALVSLAIWIIVMNLVKLYKTWVQS